MWDKHQPGRALQALAAGLMREGEGGACAALQSSVGTGPSRGLGPVCVDLRGRVILGFITTPILVAQHTVVCRKGQSASIGGDQ